MPCNSGYENEPCRPDPNLKRLKNLADKAARAACDMRTIIRRLSPSLEEELTVETREWIKKHDAEDEKRIAKENAEGLRQRVRQQALDKLSLEERRVLGL